jgi:hypothetical protein
MDEFIGKMLSDCNKKMKEDNLIIRAATGKPEGTQLTCTDIIEHLINTKNASVYLSGLRILTLMIFGENGIPEEMGVKIVGKLIREGFDKGLLSS